jgi:uncharacterized protein (DUF1697 family)
MESSSLGVKPKLEKILSLYRPPMKRFFGVFLCTVKCLDMAVVIALLRAVNLGSFQKIKMDQLRTVCESLEFRNAQTYLQSGNVVFQSRERSLPKLARALEDEIERRHGFRPDVIPRTASELRNVVARNPFANRSGIEFGKFVVTFLAAEPAHEAQERIRNVEVDAEELYLDGRELYIYFPNGIGRSRVSPAVLDRALRTPGTGRNWNTVLNLLDMADKLS